KIEIPNFYAEGSGSVYALGVIGLEYTPNLSIFDGYNLIRKALTASTNLDSYTNDTFQVLCITKEGLVDLALYEPVDPKKATKKEDKKKDE
ncbi:unnamed protein product, partial [marine sediment metagenome]